MIVKCYKLRKVFIACCIIRVTKRIVSMRNQKRGVQIPLNGAAGDFLIAVIQLDRDVFTRIVVVLRRLVLLRLDLKVRDIQLQCFTLQFALEQTGRMICYGMTESLFCV